MFTQTTISLNGFKIAIKNWHAIKSTPIIALHGWLDNANSFDLVAPYLTNHPIIAIDLPGHGYSEHIASHSHYHFIDGISFVHNIATELGLKEYHILGHSMGACLASLIAATHPTQVQKLILIEGLGPLTQKPEESFINYQKYSKALQKIMNKKHPGYASMQAAVIARARNGYVDERIAKILCERGLYQHKNRFYWRHDMRLMTPSPIRMTEQQVLSFLEQISCETCLVSASNGFEYEEARMKARRDSVEHLQYHHLSGGHHIHMEKPQEVALIIDTFLNDSA